MSGSKTETSQEMDHRLTQRQLFLALLTLGMGLTCIFFYRVVFTGDAFISRDIQLVYYPLRQFWASEIRAGRFPDWYPYDALGQPFVGMVISGAFHPSNLLYLWLPLVTAMKVNELACFPIAFWGTYLFARRMRVGITSAILAAVLYAFSGYLVTITNNLLYLMAAATLPWAFWSFDRVLERPVMLRASVAALALTLILFAGDSQSFAVACASCLALTLFRFERSRWRGQVFAAVGTITLTAAFAAVQLVPALHVFKEGRPALQPLARAEIWSMHPLRFLDLAFGPLFGDHPNTNQSNQIYSELLHEGLATLWTNSVHVGLIAITLGLMALLAYRRRRKTLLVVAYLLVLQLLVLGKYTPIYAALFKWLPIWRPFRYPEKLIPYQTFVLAIAAAAGLDWAFASDTRRKRTGALLLGAAGLSLAFWGAEYFFGAFSKLVTHLWSGVLPSQIARLQGRYDSVTLTTAGATLVFGLLLRRSMDVRVRSPLLIATAFAYTFLSNQGYYDLSYPELITQPTAFVKFILDTDRDTHLGGYRVAAAVDQYAIDSFRLLEQKDVFYLAVSTAMAPDTSALWGLENAGVYLPAVSPRVQDLTEVGGFWITRFAGTFATRYVAMPEQLFEEIHGNPRAVDARQRALHLLLLRNPNAKPRAYLARSKCLDAARIFQRMNSSAFSPDEALDECQQPLPTDSKDTLGKVLSFQYRPGRIELDAEVTAASTLVINEAYWSGWTAQVDGSPAAVLRTNYAVMGLPVTPGHHHIVLQYRTPGLVAAAWFSLLAAAFAFGFGGFQATQIWQRACQNLSVR